MDALDYLKRLSKHCVWADRALFAAMPNPGELAGAWREYSHVLAAEELWLARLQGRQSSVTVWPVLSPREAGALRDRLETGYTAYLERLTPPRLSDPIRYTNTAGITFDTAIGDILHHVMLHGQYHRGKINLLLRQGEREPAPVDYIGFVRGSPAAVTPVEG
jgi:uncharacterized damage-inducible protein DinB